MTLRYKVGDICSTHLRERAGINNYNTVPDGTIVTLTHQFLEYGWYIDHPNSFGWWAEEYLDLFEKKSRQKTGFGKFIQKVEANGN